MMSLLPTCIPSNSRQRVDAITGLLKTATFAKTATVVRLLKTNALLGNTKVVNFCFLFI